MFQSLVAVDASTEGGRVLIVDASPSLPVEFGADRAMIAHREFQCSAGVRRTSRYIRGENVVQLDERASPRLGAFVHVVHRTAGIMGLARTSRVWGVKPERPR
jgi:hypothetical protein